MTAPLSILHLLAPAEAGGLERVVHSLAIGQKAMGHRVAVAVVLDAEDDDHAFLAPLGRARVPVHRVVVPPRSYLREREAIRGLLNSVAPDVVHSHGYRTDVVDATVARGAGIATVSTAHGFAGGPLRNRLYEGIQRAVLRRFDAVIAVSQPLGDELRQRGFSRQLHVIPNAFMQIAEPLERAIARDVLRLPPDAFVVGWVGRMVPAKGLDVLIRALPELGDVRPVVCAIGSGPDRETQEAIVKQYGHAVRVVWPGLVPDASRFYSAFDAFALSSRTEGTPIALFEAMAAGVPIVATRVGGVPQIVTEEEALLVPPENPSALAAAIRQVHNAPAAAAARARRARERLQAEFGADSWLARHDEVYASVRR